MSGFACGSEASDEYSMVYTTLTVVGLVRSFASCNWPVILLPHGCWIHRSKISVKYPTPALPRPPILTILLLFCLRRKVVHGKIHEHVRAGNKILKLFLKFPKHLGETGINLTFLPATRCTLNDSHIPISDRSNVEISLLDTTFT